MTRSTRWTRRLAAGALGLVLGIAAQMPASQAASGSDSIRALYDTLMSTMRDGQALGASGRYAQIQPVVSRVFDVPYMTRLAVGPQWTSLSEVQQQQVSQAFLGYIAAIYAERFNSYAGEQLQVLGEQPASGGMLVTSRIVKSDGEPVSLAYLMRQNGGAWQIADVYLNGTISELATRRSEFGAILRNQGINGLIAMLNNKTAALSMARAG